MADLNAGGWQRFENDGVLMIGSDPIKNYVPGSLRIRERHRARIGNKDRGVLGGMTVGDQRPQEIEFQVYRTSTTNALITAMLPAATNGFETFFTLVFQMPTYQGATAGASWTWNKCMLPDGVDQEGNPGGSGDGDVDKITVRIMHHGDRVTPTTY